MSSSTPPPRYDAVTPRHCREELDHELEAQGSGDAPEGGKARGAASGFKTGNRRLRAADSGRQLCLRQAHALARLPYPFRQCDGLLA